ncbi:MAG: hypothetical protein PG981_000365 [Wolbachia endosymbiont of Ctenocephalides orientis wCori]|nr:MAG: hypothetical protein PG981_000365 [Wolbachia endosymbiont of Ctenocephalides orientis wCori]
MKKLHYSILRSAVGKGLESFTNRFIREEGGKLGGLDILKFAFLEALDEGRVGLANLIWKSELFSSQVKRSMFREAVQRDSFSVAAVRGDVETLSWLWKYSDSNTKRNMVRKHGYFAFSTSSSSWKSKCVRLVLGARQQ